MEYSYFFNKYQPFSKKEFVFPAHPVFSELQENNGLNRFLGVDRAIIDNNFATEFRIYSPEGYDPLYIRRYGELLTSAKTGSFDQNVQRSDAVVPQNDSFERNRLLNILGIKTLIDKTDDPEKDVGPDEEKFNPNKYGFDKQIKKWKFYKNLNALPRVFIAKNYEVIKDPKNIIERIYSQSFNPKETVILEEEVPKLPKTAEGEARIVSYEPNRVVVKTSSKSNSLLFLSDNFYPGWKAMVGNKEQEILRANFTFRAVVVPGGNHTVVFTYDPISVKIGVAISLLSLGFWAICLKKNPK